MSYKRTNNKIVLIRTTRSARWHVEKWDAALTLTSTVGRCLCSRKRVFIDPQRRQIRAKDLTTANIAVQCLEHFQRARRKERKAAR